jgi:hypothetical protein
LWKNSLIGSWVGRPGCGISRSVWGSKSSFWGCWVSRFPCWRITRLLQRSVIDRQFTSFTFPCDILNVDPLLRPL